MNPKSLTPDLSCERFRRQKTGTVPVNEKMTGRAEQFIGVLAIVERKFLTTTP